MTQPDNPIREAVKDFYAERVRTSQSCCTPSAADCCAPLYPTDSLSEIPVDIAGFTFGCGDPVTLAGIAEGQTVVDLGSGGGLDCFLAAQKVGASGKVIGVDMTDEMLDKAREHARRLNVANVEFRRGFIEQLPIEDGSADVIISNCVINLSPDKPQVFREVYRVLRSGGRISVSDVVTAGELPEIVQKSMEAWGACIAGAISATQYVDGLRDAGFVDVEIKSKGAVDLGNVSVPGPLPYSALITARKP